MTKINSVRASTLLKEPRFQRTILDPSMKKYPEEGWNLWLSLEWDSNIVKNLSYYGDLKDWQKIFIESMATLLIGKPITKLDELSVRECEAFLRDRNSELAVEGMTENQEIEIKKVFKWTRFLPQNREAQIYHFSSEKGPFRNLKLIDKIKELKAFLNSPEILTLYKNTARPELVDVEDLTVYIHAPYSSDEERDLFEKLHQLGVEAFQDENLNFIPES